MTPVNRVKTRGRTGGPEDGGGGGDPKFGALTITSECSGRVVNTEETRVITLMTKGGGGATGFCPKTQFAC